MRSSIERPPDNDEDDRIGSAESPRSEPSRLARVLTGAHVLVVDDDADTAELFATILAVSGADVLKATSAPEALQLFAAHTFDVVVTDVAMPRADGYWLLREIRQLEDARARTIPVLAVTAYAREHFRRRVLAAGFVDHLEKPVDPEVLCRAVAQARNR